ncbi:Guanylate kinase [Frankliniella fusca]|uniref:Guanylate kinase n=1 Tax=Frankliniella fusca TaxID=407009 RepID=A0AAE1L974_9NEOP|nr:Guanylate kinase [Frankliniella fusca]
MKHSAVARRLLKYCPSISEAASRTIAAPTPSSTP